MKQDRLMAGGVKEMTPVGGLEVGKITLSGKWFTMAEDKPLWLLALMALGGLILIPILIILLPIAWIYSKVFEA